LSSGTGYIGSFTALALLEAGYDVVIVDNYYNSFEEVANRIELICGKKPKVYNADITEEAKLDEVFEKHPEIDNVIHFAALKVSGKRYRVETIMETYNYRLLASLPRSQRSTSASMLAVPSPFFVP